MDLCAPSSLATGATSIRSPPPPKLPTPFCSRATSGMRHPLGQETPTENADRTLHKHRFGERGSA